MKVRVAEPKVAGNTRLGRTQLLVILAGFAVFAIAGMAVPVGPVGAAGGAPSGVAVATAVLSVAGLVTAIGTFVWAMVRSTRS